MTEDRMALIEAIQKADDGNFLRALAETVLQIIMDADVEALIGGGRHERSDGRLTYRNGYRDRTLDTRLGALNLRIPKLRQGLLLGERLRHQEVFEDAEQVEVALGALRHLELLIDRSQQLIGSREVVVGDEHVGDAGILLEPLGELA